MTGAPTFDLLDLDSAKPILHKACMQAFRNTDIEDDMFEHEFSLMQQEMDIPQQLDYENLLQVLTEVLNRVL